MSQYLLDVWDWEQLLQSGQEIEHQHLQGAVVVGPKVCREDILEENADRSDDATFANSKVCETLG